MAHVQCEVLVAPTKPHTDTKVLRQEARSAAYSLRCRAPLSKLSIHMSSLLWDLRLEVGSNGHGRHLPFQTVWARGGLRLLGAVRGVKPRFDLVIAEILRRVSLLPLDGPHPPVHALRVFHQLRVCTHLQIPRETREPSHQQETRQNE